MLFVKVRDCNSHLGCVPFGDVERVVGRFREFCGALSRLHAIDLQPLPANSTCPCAYIKSLKSFCGGLLEGNPHEWRKQIRSLSRKKRFSVSASLFLFRKILPTPSADLGSYMDSMSTRSPDPDPAFLRFVEDKIPKMFRQGWDRNYTRLCERSVLPQSSCVERGMGRGGVRALVSCGDSWLNRQSFCEYVLYSSHALKLKPSNVCAVDTGGKSRIVSVPSVDMNVLRPLHNAFYDHLSRFEWLLRGDARPNRFKDFSRVQGEVFVSGDYESATDNLNSQVQKIILREVLDRTQFVSEGVKRVALSSLEMELKGPSGKVVNQSRGQLMGNLLSFPLLCLVNFLAFKFFVGRKVPLRINGDDIVFRASPQESSRWMEGVGRSGLTLSKGKTLVSERFFSLNSTFFESHRKVRLVPVVRSKPMFGSAGEGVLSIRDRFRSFAVGFSRPDREVLDKVFLRVNSRFVIASRRSVRGGLGLRVSRESLESAGLLWREYQYLDQGKRYIPEVPLDDACRQGDPYKIEGWTLKQLPRTKEVLKWQRDHAAAVADRTWWDPLPTMKLQKEELKASIRDTGVDFSPWIHRFRSMVTKVARMCHVSRNAAMRRLKPCYSLPEPVNRGKVGLLYSPDGTTFRRIDFVKALT